MGGGKSLVASLIIAEAENISAQMGKSGPIEKIERAIFLFGKGEVPLAGPELVRTRDVPGPGVFLARAWSMRG